MLPRIAIIFAVSLGVATSVAYLFSALLENQPTLYEALGRTMSEYALFGCFAVSFLLIFIPLLRRLSPSFRDKKAAKRVEPVLAAAPPAEGRLPDPPPLSETQEPVPPDAQEEGGAPAEELDSGSEESGAQDESGEPAEVEIPAMVSQAVPEVSTEMLQFIGECLVPLAEAGRPLDAFNRFGLTLYFCGAGEYLASQSRLSKQEIEDILCTHMQKLGHAPEMARGFCSNIDEYLVNPKYFQMYEAGRSEMARHASDPGGALGVAGAMDVWNEPAAAESRNKKEFVAVLFTDIVGSTALTQDRGDDAAQLVVHEHNTIVREALALHGGREIKHTGDGIMATFPQITNAVDGAVAMQQACQRANAADPTLGLGLCIGVNAGEPVHEDGDIFGTPVQMAARVLSKAEGDEIAVSNLVREMCSGKNYDFAKKGDYDLKGFAEPVPIYLVAWQGGLNASLAVSEDEPVLAGGLATSAPA